VKRTGCEEISHCNW